MRKSTGYAAVAFVLSVAVAYVIGWWSGVSSVTRVATGAARHGIPVVVYALIVVALVAGVAAYRARGYLSRHDHHTPTPTV
jgi:hypothetical protein